MSSEDLVFSATTTTPMITIEAVSHSGNVENVVVDGVSISSSATQQIVQDLLSLAGASTTTYIVSGESGLATSSSGSGLIIGSTKNSADLGATVIISGATGLSSSTSGAALAVSNSTGNITVTNVGSGLVSTSPGNKLSENTGVVENSTVVLLTEQPSSRRGSFNVLEASAFSALEQAILQAKRPFDVTDNDMITVSGHTGIWANKQEVLNWKGVIPITEYQINEDVQPEVIRKRTDQILTYEQEIAIRYLRPPTPPPPGEILIRQEKNIITPPAPPLVIRQQPPRPETPPPLVIREAPPRPPAAVGPKVITISGKRIPPPPRKVVVERLPALPSKPQSVIIERWLPYSQRKRRVIFQKPTEADPVIPRPRNVIVQWETPQVQIKKEFRDLGVIRANPAEYVQTYGTALKTHIELPDFVREIRPPTGVVLAAEWNAPSSLELEGDLHALSLIDLDREGLAEYRSLVTKIIGSASGSSVSGGSGTVFVSGGGSSVSGGSVSVIGGSSSYTGFSSGQIDRSASSIGTYYIAGGAHSGNTGTYTILKSPSGTTVISLPELFLTLDRDQNGYITRDEANIFLVKLNSRLGRNYGETEVNAFFSAVDVNSDGKLNYEEFKQAVIRQFS